MHISASKMTQEQINDLVLEYIPPQGEWSEQDYLWLTDHSRRIIEFTDGYVESLPMPTDRHQTILLYLYERIREYTRAQGGKVLVAPLRLKIRDKKFREPDLLFVRDPSDPRRQNRFWLGADFVAEVVSPDDPERDLTDKPRDYAEAGIPEYWIVNPLDESITVLVLKEGDYVEHGRFLRGQRAGSVLLDFGVDVSAVFDVD